MLFLQLIAFFLLGGFLVWVVSVTRPLTWLWQMFDGCDFCFGVWVFFWLSLWWHSLTLTMLSDFYYLPFVSELVFSVVASFIVHIFRMGWRSRFHG